MFSGLVENLGLKEGLLEFKEQFNKDAKATIAETQFAKDRGIDVAKLDSWEHTLQQQREELHERTIGRAVDTLASDDTIAQLLELKRQPEEEEGGVVFVEDATSRTRLLVGGVAMAAEGLAEASRSGSPATDVAMKAATSPRGGGVATGIAAAGLGETPRSIIATPVAAPRPGSPVVGVAPMGPKPGMSPRGGAVPESSGISSATPLPRAASVHCEKLRVLECEVAKGRERKAALEVELVSAREQAQGLEARWSEIAAVSKDASKECAEASEQAKKLQAELSECDARLVEVMEAGEQLEAEVADLKRRRLELEAAFQEGLQREVSQKEQELLEEVTHLRRGKESKERRLQELEVEMKRLERRAGGAAAASAPGGSTGAPLEKHVALARAFGYDDSEEHPCLRLLDGPSLRILGWLLRVPMLRRAFFVSTAAVWVLALQSALNPEGHHGPVHT